MITLEKISVKKKITAIFDDGSRKQNLGIDSAKTLMNGHASVPVEIDAGDNDAISLLNDLAKASGFIVKTVPTGTLLEQEGVPYAFNEGTNSAGEPAVPAKPNMPVHKPAPVVDVSRIPVPATKTRGGLIVLGPKEVFTSCDKAFEAILGWEKGPHDQLPPKYHQELTQTFRNGKTEGQVQSVFKDVKRYGAENLLKKLVEFRQHIRTSTDMQYQKYRALMAHQFMPHHTETHVNGRVDMTFFKVWALCSLVEHFEKEAAKSRPWGTLADDGAGA